MEEGTEPLESVQGPSPAAHRRPWPGGPESLGLGRNRNPDVNQVMLTCSQVGGPSAKGQGRERPRAVPLGEAGLWALWGRGDAEAARVSASASDGVSSVSLARSPRAPFRSVSFVTQKGARCAGRHCRLGAGASGRCTLYF